MADVVMLLSNGFGSDPRVEKEARVLMQGGHRVTLLAWDRAGTLPKREDRHGIGVERLGPLAPYGGGLSSIGAFRDFWGRAAARAIEHAPDIVHCHDLDTYPAGARVSRTTGARLVIDFHELYRDSNMVPQSGLVGAGSRLVVGRLERRAVRRAAAVIVANPGAAAHYRDAGAGERLTLVENAPDSTLFRPRDDARPPHDRFVVGYFGQKRYIEGLRTLIRAVESDDRLGAVLAGGGTAADEVAEMAAASERIEDSGPFAYMDLPALYGQCDVVYAVYDTGLGNVRTLFPVKVMEAMACGLPSIVAQGTWIGEFVEENGVGLTVPPGDVEALTARLTELKDDVGTADAMGKRGRRLVEDGLNWGAAADRLLGVYERL